MMVGLDQGVSFEGKKSSPIIGTLKEVQTVFILLSFEMIFMMNTNRILISEKKHRYVLCDTTCLTFPKQ